MPGCRLNFPRQNQPWTAGMADTGIQTRVVVTSPTEELVQQLVKAYRYFNRELFGDVLPEPVITLNRRPNTEGYFSAQRFIRRDETTTHEIGLNPATFATRSLIHVLGTLVREMVHVSTFTAGKAGRKGYHNKHWADTMEAVGLIPTTTGVLGGKKTGVKLKHVIVKDGPFETAAKVLVESGFEITWLDRYPVAPVANDQGEVMGAELMRKSKLDVGVDPDAEQGDQGDDDGEAAAGAAPPPAAWTPFGQPGDAIGDGQGALPDQSGDPTSHAPREYSPSGASTTAGSGRESKPSGAEPEPLIVMSRATSRGEKTTISKNKFKCPQCDMQAWAKKTARLMCGDHQVAMELLEASKSPAFQSD